MSFDDATRAQIDAARPDASTWLGANAGSGKTRVLTDRVARLLLNGVEPQHILCLTYTKAAASEMQNRLFQRLGEWAMRPDDALRVAMADLGVEGVLDATHLRKARTLFASAIETPGGLKIQTIHSFCASLLRRFPLEAGVSPQFTEIEDRAADLLRADIVDEMSEGTDADLVRRIAAFYTGEDFSKLTKSITGMRDDFAQPVNRADILQALGQPPDLSAQKVENSVFLGSEADLIADTVPLLIAKGGNDAKAGAALQAIGTLDITALPALESIFLYGSGATKSAPFSAKIDNFPTKPTRLVLGAAMDQINDFMVRVEQARQPRLALAAAERSYALHLFAQAFIARYEAAKQQRGWLDFDDLILRARALLQDKEVAEWVLYRIDGGIDHILVDEAQDTSLRQWDVIEKLTNEFYSGAGARADVDRTLFVVGDKKQSIYSFQGADPSEFDRKGVSFEERITDAGQMFQHRSLAYSFRSSSAILRFVDTVFDPRRRPDFDRQTQHVAFKSALPGRVDLWPLVEKAEDEKSRPWTDPLDRRSEMQPSVILAEQIAQQIKTLTDPENPSFIPEDGPERGTLVKRPIRAGDFLILVQRRSGLFAEIIRACKAAGLPIAGADRLKVGAELAVRDIASLLSFLATPDDNLSLATALKSPLFGWGEQALFDLAYKRDVSSLSQALRLRRDEFPETLTILNDLRGQVDFLRPYDLIERILTRHRGREKLLARLGTEAEDGINAMLTQALAYERNDVPSLTGFIEWMQTDDLEIKRQIDSASNQIRVMTVHGSKGLEAPIVILPETTAPRDVVRGEIITSNGMPMWKPGKDALPDKLATRITEMKEADRAERLRLLYVALTRAEKWLIIAAAGDVKKDKGAWYDIAQEAMDHLNAVELPGTEIRRFQEGDWDDLRPVLPASEMEITAELEPVFMNAVPEVEEAPETLSPSNLGGAKALPSELGAQSDEAMAYGTLIHNLLEALPGINGPAFDTIAEQITQGWPSEIASRARVEATKALNTPEIAPIFAEGTLAEVPATGHINGKQLFGVIDRLIVTPEEVTIVDFKTNQAIPETPDDCPLGILQQMGAYARMLGDMYPGRRITTAVLWTHEAKLMHLPHDLVTTALMQSPHLDADGGRS